jgi:hypothetical protein
VPGDYVTSDAIEHASEIPKNHVEALYVNEYIRGVRRVYKYYLAQLLAVPFVGLPCILFAFLGVAAARRWLHLDNEVLGGLAGLLFANFAHRWIARTVGRALEYVGLLPSGAHRVYPHAGSWEEHHNRGCSKAV